MEVENEVGAVETERWERVIVDPATLAVYLWVRIEKSLTIMVFLDGTHQ